MNPKKTKAQLNPKIVSNVLIGTCFYKIRMVFEGADAKIMSSAKPGQFAEVRVDQLAAPAEHTENHTNKQVLLRRPFSFSCVEIFDGEVFAEILYCVLGAGTLRMTTLKKGDSIDLIGPLGTGFTVDDNCKNAILVGGGMGAAPLQSLAQYLHDNHKDINMHAFIGAQDAKGLPFFHVHKHLEQGNVVEDIIEFSKYGAKTYISTDDGSAGMKGFVTDLWGKWLGENEINIEDTVVYACGPEVMMAAVAKMSSEAKLACQVSLERIMGCGIGICQSCAVQCKCSGDESVYKLCCKDGPVFDASEVVW